MNKKTTNTLKQVAEMKKPSEAELAEAKNRALRQKLMAIAEGTYLALASNPTFADKTPAQLIARTMDLSEAWMAEFYGLVKQREEAPEA